MYYRWDQRFWFEKGFYLKGVDNVLILIYQPVGSRDLFMSLHGITSSKDCVLQHVIFCRYILQHYLWDKTSRTWTSSKVLDISYENPVTIASVGKHENARTHFSG